MIWKNTHSSCDLHTENSLTPDKKRSKSRSSTISNLEFVSAAQLADHETIYTALEGGKNINCSSDIISVDDMLIRCSTALHEAAAYGHDMLVTYLIEKGANVNQTTTAQFTPLHLACFNGFINIAIQLIDAGANTKARDSAGFMPLHLNAITKRKYGGSLSWCNE